MNITFPTADELNKKFYKGKLLELSALDLIVQDFKEAKEDLGLKREDVLEGIPVVWNHKELIEDTYGENNIYTPVMAETPYWTVYMYVYPSPELSPWTMGGTLFYNAPMYVGKGPISRVCSHGQPKGKDTTIPATMLRQYNLDFRAKKIEPLLFILAKDLDETRAKWLEADVIACLQSKYHYTRGDKAFLMAPRLLNARRETENEGHLLKLDGTFGKR